MRWFIAGLFASGFALAAFAEGENVTIDPPAAGSVSREDGLSAWERIYEVTSHPRCSNCHVGADNIPMWSGPSHGKSRPHGMNVNAGESRIGAEYVQCATCHAYREGGNDMPHAAPQVAMNWQLAPVEAAWFGKSAVDICNQLRDPDRNGGRDFQEIASHLDHDLILHWA
jgi:mono/diheme cytochrome c family protein